MTDITELTQYEINCPGGGGGKKWGAPPPGGGDRPR